MSGSSLTQLASLAGWATPMAKDCNQAGGPNQVCLTNQVTGRYSTSSPAETGKRGALNPRVGRLRGYGNAIVPQAGAAFVTACRESLERFGLWRGVNESLLKTKTANRKV
jgi:hypothetical protein